MSETAVSPPTGITIKRLFPIIAVAVFATMMGLAIISPLMPVYARDLGATGIWIGVLLASYSLSKSIFMPFVARLSDRYGRKWMLAGALIFEAAVSIGYMVSQEVWQLLLVRVLHGAAGGLIIPVAKAYIGEFAPKGEEGTWMGYYNTAFFGGMGFGPIIGGALYQFFSVYPPVFGVFDTGFIAAFGMMALLNLGGGLGVAFGLSEIGHAEAKNKPRPSFTQMRTSKPFLGLMSLQFVEGTGRTAFFSFLPIYAQLTLGLTPAETGLVLTVQVLLSASLQAVFGKVTDRLADRVSRRKIIIGGSVVIVIFMSLAPLAREFWHILLIGMISGATSALTTPATSAISVGEGRKFGMASVMAISSLAISAGMALGPVLGGVIAQATSQTSSVFYFGAVMIGVGAGLFGWFTKDMPNPPAARRRPQVTQQQQAEVKQ